MPFGKCVFNGPVFLKAIGISKKSPPKRPELEQAFPQYAKSGDGKMSKEDFIKFMLDVFACFQLIKAERGGEDGYSSDEQPPEQELRDYASEQFRNVDHDHDGMIVMNEFVEVFENAYSD